MRVSGHGDPEMFEIAEGSTIFLSLAPAAAAFLHRHHFFIAREVYIEYACVFSGVHEVGESGSF